MADKTEEAGFADDSLDVRAKYELQITQCEDMVHQGWEQDSVLAYLKLDRRGFEPLFPASWRMDFVLFPAILFTEDDNHAFIRSLSDRNWHAIHAFDEFCKTGFHVRNSQLNHTYPGRRPEAMLTKGIKAYMKWAWQDANLTQDLECGSLPSLLVVICAKHDETLNPDRADLLHERLLCKLREKGDILLARLTRSVVERPESSYLVYPPVLFGFAVLDGLVGVVAYEPISRTARTIGFFSFDDRHVEVMSAISLAIIIHWVRYNLVRVKTALSTPRGQEDDQ